MSIYSKEECAKLIKTNNSIIDKANILNKTFTNNTKKEFNDFDTIGKLLFLKGMLKQIIALNGESKNNSVFGYTPTCATINLFTIYDKISKSNTKKGNLLVNDKTLVVYGNNKVDFNKPHTEQEVIELIKHNNLVLENNFDKEKESVLKYSHGIVGLKYLNDCIESGNERRALWTYLFFMEQLYKGTFLNETYNACGDLLKSIISIRKKENKAIKDRENEIEKDLIISGYYK